MREPSAELIQRVHEYAAARNGLIYSPIAHPTFSDFPSVHGHERWEIIRPHIPDSARTVLDIGAHWGYWSRLFEEHGLKVTAVENHKEVLYFLQEIKKLTRNQFEIQAVDVLEMEDPSYDLILALNVFHHFLKRKRRLSHFKDFLGRIKCQTMIFQAHSKTEGQMRGAPMNPGPEEFCEFLIHYSSLSEYEPIGQIKNRKVFKLW